jgi:acyl carrier protein
MDTELEPAADVSGTLIELLACHLPGLPAEVDWTAVALPDVGLDSMSAIELVIDIEDRFGAEFPEHRLVRETFATFPALVAVVQEMAAAR